MTILGLLRPCSAPLKSSNPVELLSPVLDGAQVAERLHVDEQAHATAYAARSRASHGARAPTAPVDAKDFLAPALMHIPDPRRHVIR